MLITHYDDGNHFTMAVRLMTPMPTVLNYECELDLFLLRRDDLHKGKR